VRPPGCCVTIHGRACLPRLPAALACRIYLPHLPAAFTYLDSTRGPGFADDSCRMAKSSKSASDAPRTTSRRLPAWVPTAAWCIGLGGTAVALAIGVPRLITRAAHAPLPAPIRVVLRGEPSWLPKDERMAIERGIIKSLASSPFDRDGLIAAQDVAARCGWYSDVQQVHRSNVDEVVVDGRWAIPCALVCDSAGEHLIDTHGRLLPRTYPVGRGPKLLRITGVTMPRPTTLGATWTGDEISAALSMAALISECAWRSQIAAIDLSSWAKDGTLNVTSDKNCQIIWGRAPGKETASEVPAMQKLAALQLAFARSGRVDAGATVLDLRGDLTCAR